MSNAEPEDNEAMQYFQPRIVDPDKPLLNFEGKKKPFQR